MYVEFNMEMTFGIPVAIHALVRFLKSQRARHLALFAVAFRLQAISVPYYAVSGRLERTERRRQPPPLGRLVPCA